jgi:hypothetical protein
MALPIHASGQRLPERTPVEVFRIGGVDAPEYAAWARKPDIVAGPDGTIFVRSLSLPAIGVFDAAGKHVRTFGREGRGPGEFRLALRHGLLGDTLWVLDIGLMRISTFKSEGTHLRTWQLEPVDLGMRLSAPHTITALLEGPYALAVPMAHPNAGRGRLPVLVGDRDFQDFHPVLYLVRPSGMYIPEVGSFSLAPFRLPPFVSVAGNGRGFVSADWDGEDDVLIVTRYAPSGEVEWVRRIPRPTKPVPTEIRDSLISEGLRLAKPYLERARARGTLGGDSFRDLVSEGLGIPTHFPPASSILLGQDGSVWIRSGDFSDPVEWMVLDARGEPEFKVRFPRAFSVREGRLRCVWGATVDELDVPYVVRYDIR